MTSVFSLLHELSWLKTLRDAATVSMAMTASLPVPAHHGPGPFDQADTITLDEAVVETFRYVNPHALIAVRAPDESGRIVDWEVETESPNILRRIYTDGRRPGPDTITTRMGYSVGYWDGETLVAETTHLLPMLLTWDGHPISGGDTTRIVERLTRDGNELTIDYTLHDPVYWEEPLTRVVTYRYAPDLEIVDYHCDPLDALDWEYPD